MIFMDYFYHFLYKYPVLLSVFDNLIVIHTAIKNKQPERLPHRIAWQTSLHRTQRLNRAEGGRFIQVM
jgi:hypothetical protein